MAELNIQRLCLTPCRVRTGSLLDAVWRLGGQQMKPEARYRVGIPGTVCAISRSNQRRHSITTDQ
jgi:hypothetical protein